MTTRTPGMRQSGATWMLLLNIVLLALMLRLYRLDEQSAWFDEINSLLVDPTASFMTFMRHIRVVSPDHVPLYYVLMYFWGKYASLEPMTMRLVSIAFGCATIPLVYLIGRRVFGTSAGLLAALCLALSPLNVFISQAIRCNAMLTFVAALSILLAFRVAETPRWRWIVLHAVCNTVMLFTHLTSAALIAMEYVFLIAYLAGPALWRLRETPGIVLRLLAWAALHVPAALYSVYWFITLETTEDDWFTLPGPLAWLTDLLGDDAVHFSDEFAQTALPCELALQPIRPIWAIAADYAYLGLMAAGLLWGLMQCLRAARTGPVAERIQMASKRGFLLLLTAGPICAMTVFSMVWYPVLQARYSLYSSLALYCMAGGLLAALRGRFLKSLGVVALVGLYAVQLSYVLPGHTRTNWLGAVHHIVAMERGNAPIFALFYMPTWHAIVPTPADMLNYNLGKNSRPIRTVHTLAGAVDQVERALSAGEESPSCWVLVDGLAGFPLSVDLEDTLRLRGFQVQHWESTTLHLYQVRHASRPSRVPEPQALGPAEEELLAKFTPEITNAEKRAQVGWALRWAVPGLEENNDPVGPLTLGLDAMEMAPEAGIAIAEHVLREEPKNDGALLLLGLGKLALGDEASAQETFALLSSKRRAYFVRRWPGIEWTISGDHARARESFQALGRLTTSRVAPFLRYLYGMEAPPAGSALRPLSIDALEISGDESRNVPNPSL